MPPNILSDYLHRVEQAIVLDKNVYVERYEEEILTSERANLRIRLRFNKGYLLEINKAIVIRNDQLKFLDYRYHFQAEQNSLFFRYNLAVFIRLKYNSNISFCPLPPCLLPPAFCLKLRTLYLIDMKSAIFDSWTY